MSKLKLFVSHSSRLDDIDHEHADEDHNWRLLGKTCKAIRDAYGDTVEILVDQDGKKLSPGVDWEARLNQWIADCHAAIILFSKRALEQSEWVRKEATILSWRREVEDDFKLLPILLEGESTIKDLEKEAWATLKITKSQCRTAVSSAGEILEAVKLGIGTPDALKVKIHKTPFDRLEGVVSRILAEVDTETLEEAWENLDAIVAKPAYHSNGNLRFSVALTRYLFRDGEKCLSAFKQVLDKLRPKLSQPRAKELFEYVRALWVDAGAARLIPEAREERNCVAMTGRYVTDFTLERFVERAFPLSNNYKLIPISDMDSLQVIQEQIRDRFRRRRHPESEEDVDGRIRGYQMPIFLATPASEGQGRGLVDDPATRRALSKHYPKITVVMETGEKLPGELADDICGMEPCISLAYEKQKYDEEFEVEDFLDGYLN